MNISTIVILVLMFTKERMNKVLKCEVVFDIDKIKQVGEYTPDRVQKATDNAFEDYNLIKGENGFYYESGTERDFMNFSGVIDCLKSQKWFMKYIKVWKLYENMEDEDIGDYEINDILKDMKG